MELPPQKESDGPGVGPAGPLPAVFFDNKITGQKTKVSIYSDASKSAASE